MRRTVNGMEASETERAAIGNSLSRSKFTPAHTPYSRRQPRSYSKAMGVISLGIM